MPFAGLFDGFGQGSVQALAASVRHDAGRHGLASISSVTKTEIVDGIVRVHVRGRALRQPELGDSVAAAQKEWRKLAGSDRPRLQLRQGLRPRVTPNGKTGLGGR